jgi:signal peptidase I
MVWFETALVVLTLLTGVIWLLDSLYFAKRRAQKGGLLEPKEPVVVDYAKAFFPVLAVVLGLRSFVAEPFRIPSGSMIPTLFIGDFILVNKFAYGLRLPITNQKIIATGEPKRGDVVVFRPPQHPDEDWIKRVMGVPGDTVAYRDDTVYINGKPLQYLPQGRFVGTGQDAEATGAKLLLEQIPGRPHPVLERDDRPYFIQGEGQWTVPAGSYFVMGDNRDNSEDSRFWGFLPEADLRGKAFLVWMNWDGSAGGVNFRRIGSRIP